jgi:hypothetical protein
MKPGRFWQNANLFLRHWGVTAFTQTPAVVYRNGPTCEMTKRVTHTYFVKLRTSEVKSRLAKPWQMTLQNTGFVLLQKNLCEKKISVR